MTEEQEPYDFAKEGPFAPEQEADVRWPPVTVTVSGPNKAANFRAGVLMQAALGPPAEHKIIASGSVVVTGFVDRSIEEFVDRAIAAEKRVAELEKAVDSAHLTIRKMAEHRDKMSLELELEHSVGRALESRLGDSAARKLALAVAHGDVPADQFEARRRIEVNGVRDLVAGVRKALRTLPRNMAQDSDG